MSNYNYSRSGNFKVWVIVLGVLVVLGTLTLLAVLKNSSSKTNYGIFLTRGLVETWSYEYGLANFSVEDEKGDVHGYSVYVTDQAKFLKVKSDENNPTSNNRILQDGSFGEIKDGIFFEMYLDKPYEDLTRSVKTIIYWE